MDMAIIFGSYGVRIDIMIGLLKLYIFLSVGCKLCVTWKSAKTVCDVFIYGLF